VIPTTPRVDGRGEGHTDESSSYVVDMGRLTTLIHFFETRLKFVEAADPPSKWSVQATADCLIRDVDL
jgi:hypothetical protein